MCDIESENDHLECFPRGHEEQKVLQALLQLINFLLLRDLRTTSPGWPRRVCQRSNEIVVNAELLTGGVA